MAGGGPVPLVAAPPLSFPPSWPLVEGGPFVPSGLVEVGGGSSEREDRMQLGPQEGPHGDPRPGNRDHSRTAPALGGSPASREAGCPPLAGEVRCHCCYSREDSMATAANRGSALSLVVAEAAVASVVVAGVAAGTSQYSGTGVPPWLLAWANKKVLGGSLAMALSWNFQVPNAGCFHHP